MEVVTERLSALVEDPKNARTHDRRNIEAIKASLSRFGQVEPLVVRAGAGVVVGGNGRLAAMRELGWEEASVTYVELTDPQAAALGIALNRTADLAGWDEARLADLIAEIAWDDEMLPVVEDLDLGSIVGEDLVLAALAGGSPEPSEKPVTSTQDLGELVYSVIADFDDETSQSELLRELEERGIKCRLLIA